MGVFVQPPFWATGYGRALYPHMTSVVVTPPAPLFTRDQAKLRAGAQDWLVAGDPREELLDGFVLSAQHQVQTDTGIALLTQTIDVSLDRVPYDWTPIALPYRPVVSVTSVKSYDTAGVQQTLAPSNYVLDPSSAAALPARLGLAIGGVWPTDLRPFQPITIRLVVGFANLAALQVAAPELVDAAGLLIAHAVNTGRDRFTQANLRDEYEEKIAAYRLVTVA